MKNQTWYVVTRSLSNGLLEQWGNCFYRKKDAEKSLERAIAADPNNAFFFGVTTLRKMQKLNKDHYATTPSYVDRETAYGSTATIPFQIKVF